MALQCDSKHKCITHFTPAFQYVLRSCQAGNIETNRTMEQHSYEKKKTNKRRDKEEKMQPQEITAGYRRNKTIHAHKKYEVVERFGV